MQEQNSTTSEQSGSAKERVLTGVVVSDKMQKTGVVLIERKVKHPMYGKYVKKSTRIKFHDEKSEAKVGDKVHIKECRPISKQKSWMLAEIVTKAG